MEILTKEDLLKTLKANGNKEAAIKTIVAQKKMEIKRADGFSCDPFASDLLGKPVIANKANIAVAGPPDQLKVRVVINTTNFLDSHMDVHYPGLWGKSLKDNKFIMHLQEHKQGFKFVISDNDDLKAYAKTFTWKELGYDFEGKTEALIFDSVVKKPGKKARCEEMYEAYSEGYVRNHSVKMQYVKMVLCVNEPDDEYFGAEFEAWEKYYPEIVNKERADERGYFWLIKEAKVIEGSAVPIGSNSATPTLENNLKHEPGDHSGGEGEPLQDTHKAIDYDYLAGNFKL